MNDGDVKNVMRLNNTKGETKVERKDNWERGQEVFEGY